MQTNLKTDNILLFYPFVGPVKKHQQLVYKIKLIHLLAQNISQI